MSFDHHVSALCQKAGEKLNALSRLSSILNVQSKRIVYESFIASQFGYCTVLWKFCSVSSTVSFHINVYLSNRTYLYCIFDVPEICCRKYMQLFTNIALFIFMICSLSNQIFMHCEMNVFFMSRNIIPNDMAQAVLCARAQFYGTHYHDYQTILNVQPISRVSAICYVRGTAKCVTVMYAMYVHYTICCNILLCFVYCQFFLVFNCFYIHSH